MTNSRQLVAGLRGSSNREPERESVRMRACVCVSFLFYAHVAEYTRLSRESLLPRIFNVHTCE